MNDAASFIHHYDGRSKKVSPGSSTLRQQKSPIAFVNIRPNKITVYLNALTEDGQFECKQL